MAQSLDKHFLIPRILFIWRYALVVAQYMQGGGRAGRGGMAVDKRGRFGITFGISFLHTLVSTFHANYCWLITMNGKVNVFLELCRIIYLLKRGICAPNNKDFFYNKDFFLKKGGMVTHLMWIFSLFIPFSWRELSSKGKCCGKAKAFFISFRNFVIYMSQTWSHAINY